MMISHLYHSNSVHDLSPPKKSKANGSNQKGFNLFESLISTNFIDKCPFDLEPYRENVADY